MKIAIGCDHGGFILKSKVIEGIEELGFEYLDYGTFSEESVDYPIIAQKVCDAIIEGKADKGILLCGTGIGMSIVANKIDGIRCGHVTDIFSAEKIAEHNNANVIALGGRITTPYFAKDFVKKFLTTEFAGGRHQKRVDMMTKIENGEKLS